GGWQSGTVAEAYALNDPLIVMPLKGSGEGASAAQPFVTVNKPNVIIETIKQAEDDSGIVVRLYENERCRGSVTLTAGFSPTSAVRCNLLEEDKQPLELHGREVRFSIKPYEIITLKLGWKEKNQP
ncbi:MAG: glycosyl hydrolase-related protein, partial [Chloroflexota bacterium]